MPEDTTLAPRGGAILFPFEDFHTYYVGECGVWVHNAEGYSENLIPNKKDGLRRENKVQSELQEKYPESEGYKIESERLLRDSNGKKRLIQKLVPEEG